MEKLITTPNGEWYIWTLEVADRHSVSLSVSGVTEVRGALSLILRCHVYHMRVIYLCCCWFLKLYVSYAWCMLGAQSALVFLLHSFILFFIFLMKEQSVLGVSVFLSPPSSWGCLSQFPLMGCAKF